MLIETMDGSIIDLVVDDDQKITDKERWSELKKLISISNSEDVLIDGPNNDNPHFTCDQRWGFDESLSWVEKQMNELEKL